jgi:predicted DNA-binding transcriptional regulator AlpA
MIRHAGAPGLSSSHSLVHQRERSCRHIREIFMSELDLSNRHERRRAAALERRETDNVTTAVPLNRVRSFPETAEICGISLATLRRRIKDGTGPRVTSMSERRKGVTDRDRNAWLEECANTNDRGAM